MAAATDSTAKLMQLSQPEAIGFLNNHDRSIRNIDTHFNHRRGNQYVRFMISKTIHHRMSLLAIHSTMQQVNPQSRKFSR